MPDRFMDVRSVTYQLGDKITITAHEEGQRDPAVMLVFRDEDGMGVLFKTSLFSLERLVKAIKSDHS